MENISRSNKKETGIQKIHVSGDTVEELLECIEKVEVIETNDRTFTFIAHLKFIDKADAEKVFSPIVVNTWEIDLLPLLKQTKPGLFQR